MARKKPHTAIDEIRVRSAMQGLLVSNGSKRGLVVRDDRSWKKVTGHASKREREDVQKPWQA